MLLKAPEGSLYQAHATPFPCQVSAQPAHDHAELVEGSREQGEEEEKQQRGGALTLIQIHLA